MFHNPSPSPSHTSMAHKYSVDNYHWLGFDLDHTVVRYKLDAHHKLIHDCIWRYLVEMAGYPEALRKHEVDYHRTQKGLVLDRELGNIFKLTKSGQISRAYHGSRKLSHSEIKAAYPQKIEFEGLTTTRFWSLSSYFEGSVGLVFSEIVDWISNQLQHTSPASTTSRSHPKKESPFAAHAAAIYDALVYNFAEWRRGWFFPEMVKNTSHYVYTGSDLRDAILKKRKTHKIALITNSLPEYTLMLLSFIFGERENFTEIFDLIFFAAKKPNFWISSNSPCQEVTFVRKSNFVEVSPSNVAELQIGKIWYQLEMFLESDRKRNTTKAISPQKVSFCYFGDHLVYDVSTPKQICKLDTVAIVEELCDPLLNQPHNIWGSFFSSAADHHDISKHSDHHQHHHAHDDEDHTWWNAHVRSHANYVVAYLEKAL